jgi:hypothetical protein
LLFLISDVSFGSIRAIEASLAGVSETGSSEVGASEVEASLAGVSEVGSSEV